jgi:RimJ/RimL family protein N-acetyltransferase
VTNPHTQANSRAHPAPALPLRWIKELGGWLFSQLTVATLQPLAREIPVVTTREPSLAAWIDSISEPTFPSAPLQVSPHRDTSSVLIRPIEARDRTLLSDGFARLSPRSRQLRFLAAKASLSSADLDFLTNVDHRDREALVALTPADGRGVGVARYARDLRDPEAAEVAVTVIDEWHRRGIGTQLITQLIARAQDEGIRRFTALIADDNLASIRLLRSLDLDARVLDRDHQTTEYGIALPIIASASISTRS